MTKKYIKDIKPAEPFKLVQGKEPHTWQLADGFYLLEGIASLRLEQTDKGKVINTNFWHKNFVGNWYKLDYHFVYNVEFKNIPLEDVQGLSTLKLVQAWEVAPIYKHGHYVAELAHENGERYYVHIREFFLERAKLYVYLMPKDTDISEMCWGLDKAEWLPRGTSLEKLDQGFVGFEVSVCLEAVQHIVDWLVENVPFEVIRSENYGGK
jgi:hypothetical protein